jgi:hypothetical protein
VPTWLSPSRFGILGPLYSALSISQAPRLVWICGKASGKEEGSVLATPGEGAEEQLKEFSAGLVAVSVVVFLGEISELSAELLFLQGYKHRGG